MTDSERARTNLSILKSIADQIETVRLDLYSNNVLNDYDDKAELDNMLFAIQSKLRFDAIEILEYYI